MPWTNETAEIICREISCGKSVAKACEIAGCAPDTWWLHLAKDKRISDEYARARESKAHVRAESIDTYKEQLLRGEIDAQTFRVLVDAIKWQAGKELPKVYGERVELSGIPAATTNVVLPPLEQLRRMRAVREQREALGEGDVPRGTTGQEKAPGE